MSPRQRKKARKQAKREPDWNKFLVPSDFDRRVFAAFLDYLSKKRNEPIPLNTHTTQDRQSLA